MNIFGKMKVFLVGTLMLAAAASAQIYMTEYNEYTCKGSVARTSTIPTGTCDTNQAGVLNITGINFTCPSASAPKALCGVVSIYFGTEKCGKGFGDITQNAPCGECIWAKERGYHQFVCDQVKRLATLRSGCDQMCGVCEDTTVLPLGECAATNGSYSSMKLQSMQTCPAFIHEEVWYGGNKCTGGSTHTMWLEQGACYEGLTFSCTPPGKGLVRSFHSRFVDPMREKAVGKMMLARFLHHQHK
jgi:hypothetical protein